MKNINRTNRLICLVWIAISSLTSVARDLGELRLDDVYDIDADFQAWSAKFTATKSGAISTISTGGLTFTPYYDAEHTEQMPYNGSYVDGGYAYTINVEAGKTYYFYTSFSINAAQFSIFMSSLEYAILPGVDATCKVVARSDGKKYFGDLEIPEVANINGTDYRVVEIGQRAFDECKALTSVVIPKSVKTIGEGAFYNCNYMLSVSLPNSLASIGESAFRECSSIKTLDVPNSVTNIGDWAFAGCSNLKSAKLSESLSCISDHLFAACGELESLTIPSTVTSIGVQAFYYCARLNSVYIPNSVKKIDILAFQACWKLKAIRIPMSVTEIAENAFIACGELESILVENPDPSKIILGSEVFKETPTSTCKLKVPTGSKSLYAASYQWKDFTNIEEFASLEYQIISASNATCRVVASSSGAKYTGDIEIPATTFISGKEYKVVEIGSNAFDGCDGLTSVIIPNTITTINEKAFYECKNLREIVIPNSVTYIGDRTFNRCISATSVSISNSLTVIPYCLFEGCTSLTSIEIPNSVIEIGEYAISWCENLKFISIPSSVVALKNSVFWQCNNLEDIYIQNTNPSSITFEDRTFYKADCCTLLVPQGCKELYLADSRWSIFGYIDEYPKEHSDELSYEIISEEDATCKVTGSVIGKTYSGDIEIPETTTINGKNYTVVAIADYSFADYSKILSVTIPTTITEIPESSFYNCRSLSSVEMPNTITAIRDRAFEGCISITSINIPSSVTYIGYLAFDDCVGLTSVSIPDSVTDIGSGAFADCDNLTAFYGKFASEDNRCLIFNGNLNAFARKDIESYTIPNTVNSIGYVAFYRCTGLTSIIIPNSLTVIGMYGFSKCTGLTSMVIPNSVTRIEGYAFESCIGLNSIDIPNSVETIRYGAFKDCVSLSSVTIPNSVTSIGEKAFYNCSGLKWFKVINSNPSTINIDKEALQTNSQNCILYVPRGSKSLYEADSRWDGFSSIEEYDEEMPNYEFTAVDITAHKGRMTMLPVSMNNVGGIVSFQCDVTLPEGVTVHQEDGVYAIEASDRFDNTHSISASMQGGKLRIVSFSMSNHSYKGNDGVLFSIPIEVSDDLTDGQECELIIDNIMLTKADLTNYDADNVKVQITVGKKFIPGDVNDDGRYTILDASMVIAYILGQDPANGIKDAADVNGDGKITVLDASLVVSYVLDGRPVNAAAKAPAADVATATAEQASIRFEDNKAYISIPDASRFVAGQLELLLPKSAEVASISLVGVNADSHSLAWRKGDNGVINLATYSLSNSPLSGEDLIEITFANNCHAGEIAVSNVLMTSLDNDYYEEKAFASAYATIGTDGITDTTNELIIYVEDHNLVVISPTETTFTISSVDGKWHALDANTGKNIYPLNAGFYFVNNKKIIVK